MMIAIAFILLVLYYIFLPLPKTKVQEVPTVPLEHFKDTVAELNATIAYLRKDCEFFEKGLQELKSQQQSKSVRLGQISEVSVGLLPNFPFDIKEMRFLGSPIDFVAFDFENEKIYFLEVKTGKSKLNERQKIVKRMIENKSIEFIQLKITENGVEYE